MFSMASNGAWGWYKWKFKGLGIKGKSVLPIGAKCGEDREAHATAGQEAGAAC